MLRKWVLYYWHQKFYCTLYITNILLFYQQILYYLLTLTGKHILPSTEAMKSKNLAIDQERKARGIPDHIYHRMSGSQPEYLDDLISDASLPPRPSFLFKLFSIHYNRAVLCFPIFRTYKYEIQPDGSIVEMREGRVINTKWDIRRLKAQQYTRLIWRDFTRVMIFFVSDLMKRIKFFLHLS